VKRTFPVRRIVLIDHNSVDATSRIGRENGCEIIEEDKGLSYARELSFRLAETEVFGMVESDLVYREYSWYRRAVGLMTEKVAAVVAYVPREQGDVRGRYNEFWGRVTPLRSRRHGFSAGSTLMRREAVRGMTLPTVLNAYEDLYLLRQLRRKGWTYRYIEVRGVHYSDEGSFRKARWYGGNARVLYSLEPNDPLLIRRHVLLPFKGAVASAFTLDPEPFVWSVGFAANFFVGWSRPNLYASLKR
jgi:glycosyltransferase involved in cell wall biosynthesis